MLTHRDILRRAGSSYSSRIALAMVGGPTLTYSQLDKVTNCIARGLLDRGLRPGDRLLWIDQNSVEYLLAYLATAKAGMMISPMNYWLRAHEIAPLASLVSPAAVVTGAAYGDLAVEALGEASPHLWISLDGHASTGWTEWSELAANEAGPVDVGVDEHTLHEVIFTSGTTGQAKGVMRTQRARLLDAFAGSIGYELTREDHMLWFLPQFHVGGAAGPLQLLIQGGRVSLLRRFDPYEAAKAINEGVTYMVGVPTHYIMMIEAGALDGVDTSRVRGCYVGGSMASPAAFEAIQHQFPNAELVHGYGSTESGPYTMALRGEAFLEHFGALGLPVPGTEVRVVDPFDLEPVPAGEVGELWIRSDAVMVGYLDRPDLTEQAFTADGLLRTGDLVRQEEDGYFYFVDREKEMIITGGENVYPREVEDILSDHPAVVEAAVIGVPDPVYTELVAAIVRTSSEAQQPDEQDLIAFVREHVAGFKTPKEIHFVNELPRTGVGKVAKQKLREQYGTAVEGG